MRCKLIGVGPIVVISITFFSQESPRYLVEHNENTAALKVLADHYANGDVNDPLVKWEYHEIMVALEHEEFERKTSYED